ncbi:MAG: hypothetical protein KIT39_05050 [Nitrospirales bacterium]|nr:hypothetical protein [Nitrospirales bacterium]
MVQNFETLLRTWNIKGRSVRPDHRMVAHSGFITVARKVENNIWNSEQYHAIEPASQEDDHVIKEDEYVGDGLDIP